MILEKQKFDLKEVEGEEIYVLPWGRGGRGVILPTPADFPLITQKQ